MRIQLNFIRILQVLCLFLLLVVACGHWPAQSAYATPPSGDFQEAFNLPQDPEALLKDILSRKEFTDAATRSLLDRLIAYLNYLWRKALSWILDRWPSLGPISLGNESIWSAVGILLITAILAVIITRLARFFALGFQKRRGAGVRIYGSRNRTRKFRGDAGTSRSIGASGGGISESLILLFRFVLLRLDELGHIKWRPCKTNREILRSVHEDTTDS